MFRRLRSTTIVILFPLLLTGVAGARVLPPPPPNILFVILDDVGVDQLGLYGFGGAVPPRMPNLERLAGAGLTFTNVWPMPECSPTRAAFFTGRYPLRRRDERDRRQPPPPGRRVVVRGHAPAGAREGYVSALVGKYHLGNERDPAGECAPVTRGWHRFVGNMTAGPPSIDRTAGGGDDTASQACGYFQTPAPGACDTARGDTITRRTITAGNADPDTSPSG